MATRGDFAGVAEPLAVERSGRLLAQLRRGARARGQRLFTPFLEMERAGLEPATPSLQILLRGGLEGSVVVAAEEASRLVHVASSALVAVGRRV